MKTIKSWWAELDKKDYESLIKYKTILSYVSIYATVFGFFLFLKIFNLMDLKLNYKIFILFIPIYYLSMLFLYGYSIKELTINFISIITIYNFALEFNPLKMLQISSEYYISNILYFYLSFLIVTFNFKIYERLSNGIDIFFGQLIYLRSNPFIAYLILIFTLFIYKWAVIYIFDLANFYEIFIQTCLFLFWLVIFVLPFFMIIDIKNKNKNKNKNNSYNILIYTEIKKRTTKYEHKINKIVSSFLDVVNIKRLEDLKYERNNEEDEQNNKIEKIREYKIKIFFHIVIIKITKVYPLILLIMLTNNYAYYGMYLEKNEKYCKEVDKEIYENSLIVKLKDGDILRMDKDTEKKYSFILNQISCEKTKNLIKVSEGDNKGKSYYKM